MQGRSRVCLVSPMSCMQICVFICVICQAPQVLVREIARNECVVRGI